ncbi:MAG: hypothetical protein ABJC89_15630 [Acidobacteriota bacterium]
MRIPATMIALALAIPASVMAQEPVLPTAATAVAASPDPAVQGPATGVRKRRGSMVGYVEDASIRTQVRVRFDAGFGVNSPDRAEFFYGKCGCYRGLDGTPLFDADAPGPGPGIVTNMDFQSFRVMGEFALSDRFSVFADVPFRSIKPQSFVAGTGSFGNQSGLGDVEAGVKLGLVSDDRRNLTVLVRGSFPTGDSKKGLGTDHASIEPALLYRQDLSDRVSIESQFGEWHPIGGSQGPLVSDKKFAGDVLYYGIGPSFDVVRTDTFRFSPVVELVGWHVINGFQTSTLLTPTGGDASGVNIVNLKVGARTTFRNGGSFYAGFGWGLTDSIWYDKVLRIEYRAGF